MTRLWFRPKGMTGSVVRYRSSFRLALIGCVFLPIPIGRLPIRAAQPFPVNRTLILSLKNMADPIISDLAQRTRFWILNKAILNLEIAQKYLDENKIGGNRQETLP